MSFLLELLLELSLCKTFFQYSSHPLNLYPAIHPHLYCQKCSSRGYFKHIIATSRPQKFISMFQSHYRSSPRSFFYVFKLFLLSDIHLFLLLDLIFKTYFQEIYCQLFFTSISEIFCLKLFSFNNYKNLSVSVSLFLFPSIVSNNVALISENLDRS